MSETRPWPEWMRDVFRKAGLTPRPSPLPYLPRIKPLPGEIGYAEWVKSPRSQKDSR
jgi:hypothetical protein